MPQRPRKGRSDEVVIRNFAMADYDRVMEIWAAGRLPLKLDGRDSRSGIESQLRRPNVAFLVAESDGRVVGTVMATHDGRKGWINRLGVDEALRKRGIGRRLVQAAEERLAAEGLEIFTCLIEDWNTVSMAVFERLVNKKHPEIIYFAKRKHPGV
ncbi:MAG: GNAT family N-acetyltransferase [Acidobacteriota bacterium]